MPMRGRTPVARGRTRRPFPVDTIHGFEDRLALLRRHRVRYLMVGGLAFLYHAKPRFTKDVDLWIEPARDNLGKANRALSEFGSPELLEFTPRGADASAANTAARVLREVKRRKRRRRSASLRTLDPGKISDGSCREHWPNSAMAGLLQQNRGQPRRTRPPRLSCKSRVQTDGVENPMNRAAQAKAADN
jgi:hypothetical protein